MISQSFASHRPYVVLQARMYPEGLHVQGNGHEGNRRYGISATFPVAREIAYVFNTQKRELPSLAGTGQVYVQVQARPRQETIHFQLKDGAFNRSYGAAFDVSRKENEALWLWLAEEILYNQ